MPPRSFYRPPDFEHLRGLMNSFYEDAGSRREIDRLCSSGIPPLIDRAAIHICLGVSSHLVYGITLNKARHYRRFPLERPGKEPRIIDAPRTYLKAIQWWILDNIFTGIVFDEHVHGFVPGKSTLTNARSHLSQNRILNVDIEKFFPSIDQKTVKNVFSSYGYSEDVANQLSALCTYQDQLPQGAPTSPIIANVVAAPLDCDLLKYCRQNGLKYSRYADDLTFSRSDFMPIQILGDLDEIVRSHGFSLNREKTRFCGPGTRQDVTGFVVNVKPQPTREWRNRVRGIFHRARMNPTQYADMLDKLVGYMGTIRMYDPECETKLAVLGLEAISVVRAGRRF